MADDAERQNAARQFWDALAVTTEHQDITKVEAIRQMCESTIAVFDGDPDNQHYADWAREALRLLDERQGG